MKRPINIYKRYRKPRRWFDSYGTVMTAVTAALGASQIGILSATPIPKYRGEYDKTVRAVEIAKATMSTAIGIIEIQKGAMVRRFKATKRYVR